MHGYQKKTYKIDLGLLDLQKGSTNKKGGRSMYRQYEDPREVKGMLEEAKKNNDGTPESKEWIHELEERLNFAWQDDEATVYGYD